MPGTNDVLCASFLPHSLLPPSFPTYSPIPRLTIWPNGKCPTVVMNFCRVNHNRNEEAVAEGNVAVDGRFPSLPLSLYVPICLCVSVFVFVSVSDFPWSRNEVRSSLRRKPQANPKTTYTEWHTENCGSVTKQTNASRGVAINIEGWEFWGLNSEPRKPY